jgi:5-methylcytosine-specific restriction endonuclease McrA
MTDELREAKRQKHREYMREYNQRPGRREAEVKRVKEWRKKNPGHKRSGSRQVIKEYRAVIVHALQLRDGPQCGLCGDSLLEQLVSIDHVVPVALGGQHVLTNLQLVHPKCNSRQGGAVRRMKQGY